MTNLFFDFHFHISVLIGDIPRAEKESIIMIIAG